MSDDDVTGGASSSTASWLPRDVTDVVAEPLAPVALPLRRRIAGKRADEACIYPAMIVDHQEVDSHVHEHCLHDALSVQPCIERQGAAGSLAGGVVCKDEVETGSLASDTERNLRSLVWTRVRNLWVREKLSEIEEQTSKPMTATKRAQARSQLLRKFARVRDDEKNLVAQRALNEARCKGDQADLIAAFEERVSRDPDMGKVFVDRRKCFMLTYNGPWGRIPLDSFPAAVLASASKVENICAYLKHQPEVLSLASALTLHFELLAKKLRVSRWSCCLELCETSAEVACMVAAAGQSVQPAEAVQYLRVHAHAFFDADTIISVRMDETMFFQGHRPHLSKAQYSHCSSRGRATAAAAAAGHYYVQAPKLSSIWTKTTHCVYTNWGLRPEWITQYWSQGKMSDAAAIAEYLRLKRDAKRHIQNVRDNASMRDQQTISQLAKEVRERLAARKRPRLFIPEVEVDFLGQFRDDTLHRRKFLVLDGGTRTGKTEYARSLASGPSSYVELNCANTEHVALRAFSPVLHDLILWDEAPASLVLANKKLFQGQAVEIMLGQTNTSRDAYSVFPWGCKMVVCSNLWEFQLSSLPYHDVDWLRKNSIVIHVSRPLWQLSAAGGA